MAFFSSMALKATQGETPYKYLSVIINDIETQGYLEYSADEVVDPNAKFAVENAHNGLVHIRSCRTNKYWVSNEHNKGGPVPSDGDCSFPECPGPDFDLDNSRIYNMNPMNSETHTYDNPTNEEQEPSMNLTISTTKTSTWNNSISVKAGVETRITTGIPFIAEGEITVSAEASYEHGFGGTLEETQQVGDTYTVKVPPFKRVTGRGVATKGTCDVPFTYTQVDHLTDGTTIRTTLYDGVFTGVNAYNFYHDVHYEDIPDKQGLA